MMEVIQDMTQQGEAGGYPEVMDGGVQVQMLRKAAR